MLDSDLESGQSSNGHGIGLVSRTSKKRKTYGRVMKKIRLNSHTAGDNCKSEWLKCFENVPLDDRRRIIREFNELDSYDLFSYSFIQNAYFGGLITALPVQRRRNRKPHNEARINSSSFPNRE